MGPIARAVTQMTKTGHGNNYAGLLPEAQMETLIRAEQRDAMLMHQLTWVRWANGYTPMAHHGAA